MKITLEFEDEDLRNMLTTHFLNAGFSVKNLDDICAAFKEAFPHGLRVLADPAPLPEPQPDLSPPKAMYREPEKEDPDALPEPKDDDENPVLTIGDIMDPTPRRNGRKEAVLKSVPEDVASIDKIVRRSRELEKEGKNNA